MDARGRTNGVYYGKYVGELKDGYYHGKGTFTYDNGTMEELEGMMTKAEILRAKERARDYQKKTISWPLR